MFQSWLLLLLSFSDQPLVEREMLEKVLEREAKPFVEEYLMDYTFYYEGRNTFYEMKVFRKGYDKILMEYLSPVEIKGRVILITPQKKRFYFPVLNDILDVSEPGQLYEANKYYSDVLNLNLYNYKIVSFKSYFYEQKDDSFLILIRNEDPSHGFYQVENVIDKTNLNILRRVFILRGGLRVKTLEYGDHDERGRWRSVKMSSILTPKEYAVIKIHEITPRTELDDSFFNLENLIGK